jgi:uracil-DNA glycosylase
LAHAGARREKIALKNSTGRFIRELKNHPKKGGVFNPWWQRDLDHDRSRACSKQRRRHLSLYLKERGEKAKYLLLGEALGYRGGHFSGIPMTSERILLGGKRDEGILPEHVFSGAEGRRTSREDLNPHGFSEPTATIVWEEIIRTGLDPKRFLLWNAFPWHSYQSRKGLLSNRSPSREEVKKGDRALKAFMALFGIKTVITLGKRAEEQTVRLGIPARKFRHPASGGAAKFRSQFAAWVRTESRKRTGRALLGQKRQ